MLQDIIQVQRQVIGWFEVADKAAFSMQKFPVFIFDDPQLGEYYGFPEFDNLPGMKIGKFYHLNEAALPDQLSRDITSADEQVCCLETSFLSGSLAKKCSKACVLNVTQSVHSLTRRS